MKANKDKGVKGIYYITTPLSFKKAITIRLAILYSPSVNMINQKA